MKRSSPFIIPLFLPHAACPHHCLFCNQKTLHPGPFPDQSSLGMERDRWLAFPRDKDRPVEVAFFGGNFLGLPEKILHACLSLVAEIPGAGLRFSTRPDTISSTSLGLLKSWEGRATAELGVQSLDEEVLRRAGRGHDVGAVSRAVQILRTAGMRVGAQMMLGLPGASEKSDLNSARSLAALKVDFARVSPTLVLAGSGLARLYHRGRYHPLSLDEAVSRSASVVDILEKACIPVVRIGLQADAALVESLVAGPHHPALGEWVRGFLLANQVLEVMAGLGRAPLGKGFVIRVSTRLRGRLQGMGGCNMARFQKEAFPASLWVKTEKNVLPDFWSVEHAFLEAAAPFKGPAA